MLRLSEDLDEKELPTRARVQAYRLSSVLALNEGFQSDGSSFFGLFTRGEILPHSHLVGRVGEQQRFHISVFTFT
jgi:hypothetical protein